MTTGWDLMVGSAKKFMVKFNYFKTQIMKNILFVFSLLVSFLLSAQETKSVYILFDSNSKMQVSRSEDKSTVYEVYDFDITPLVKSITLSEEDGHLNKAIIMPSGKANHISFKYESHKKDNKAIKIKADVITNRLTYNEMLSCDFNNLIEVLQKFPDVYIINEASSDKGFYTVKKVTLQPQKPGL